MAVSELEGHFSKEQIERAVAQVRLRRSLSMGTVGAIGGNLVAVAVARYLEVNNLMGLLLVAVCCGLGMRFWGSGDTFPFPVVGVIVYLASLALMFLLQSGWVEITLKWLVVAALGCLIVAGLSYRPVSGDRVLQELRRLE